MKTFFEKKKLKSKYLKIQDLIKKNIFEGQMLGQVTLVFLLAYDAYKKYIPYSYKFSRG